VTERQERTLRIVVNLTVSAVTLAILVRMAWPGWDAELRRLPQWARYWRWLATRSPVPGWVELIRRDDLPDEVAS